MKTNKILFSALAILTATLCAHAMDKQERDIKQEWKDCRFKTTEVYFPPHAQDAKILFFGMDQSDSCIAVGYDSDNQQIGKPLCVDYNISKKQFEKELLHAQDQNRPHFAVKISDEPSLKATKITCAYGYGTTISTASLKHVNILQEKYGITLKAGTYRSWNGSFVSLSEGNIQCSAIVIPSLNNDQNFLTLFEYSKHLKPLCNLMKSEDSNEKIFTHKDGTMVCHINPTMQKLTIFKLFDNTPGLSITKQDDDTFGNVMIKFQQ
jgi:hypothetical protein